MKNKIFWIFGTLQSLSLAAIIFLLFQGLNEAANNSVIGMDSQVVLSLAFPLFFLLTQYTIHTK